MTITSTSLSGEEVSALMAELGDAGAPVGEVRPFALGQEAIRPAVRLAGLERMGERMAQTLRTAIEPIARSKTQVAAEAIETLRFDEWRVDLPVFTSLNLYRAKPLKNGFLIAIEPDFIARMVDAFYGGSGSPGKPKTKEFTPTEERMLARLCDIIIEKLAEIWADLAPLAPTLASRETNTAYASLVRGDEAIIVQRFAVTPASGRPSYISIIYPLAALRPFEAHLAVKVRTDDGPVDRDWRARISAALEGVRLPVRSVLARPELTVSQLMALKVGDVIPITLAPKVPLIVASRKIAHGTIGEREGRAALMIEKVEGDSGNE